MNYNSSIYRRQIYGILEWFGDLGGVLEAFTIIFSVLTGLWAQINLESALVSHLYHIKPEMGDFEKEYSKEQNDKFSRTNLKGLKTSIAQRE